MLCNAPLQLFLQITQLLRYTACVSDKLLCDLHLSNSESYDMFAFRLYTLL